MTRRDAIGTTLVVVVVVIVIIIGTVGFVMLSSPSTPSPNSATSSTGSPTTSSTTSATGLRLTESISALTITEGQSLNASMSILNTHDALNSIQPSDQWAFQGVPVSLWPACYFSLPAQMVVLNGSYTEQDLQRVANSTFNYGCAEGVEITQIVFQASSDQVNITGEYSVTGASQTHGPFQMALNFTTGGSWNLRALSQEPNIPILSQDQSRQPNYTAFAPGVYTVAVADEWGQAVVMHFTVVAASSSSASKTTTTSSSSPSGVTTTSFSPSISTVSTDSTLSTVTVIVPQGATYPVQSSYDCLAGHFAQPFNVTTNSLLAGEISASQPGVTLYVSTAQDAQTVELGHPAAWVYTSGLTNSTSFSLLLSPGSYVFWTEGADMGCGASTITPLEQLTTVTAIQAVTLTPS